MTTIYLVRHAHSAFSPSEARPLSAAGASAARALADLLAPQPIAAIHSSPARRAFETVAPLAQRLDLPISLHPDLRERELPAVPDHRFEAQVRTAWAEPSRAVPGGESNVDAQTRALTVVHALTTDHDGQNIVIATHGNLLTLILNAMDTSFGFEFWQRLSLPDIYAVHLDGTVMRRVERRWPSA